MFFLYKKWINKKISSPNRFNLLYLYFFLSAPVVQAVSISQLLYEWNFGGTFYGGKPFFTYDRELNFWLCELWAMCFPLDHSKSQKKLGFCFYIVLFFSL